jgi:light-regulated signal transduction histidine kinase (bacteriophytochrome)
VEIGWLPRQENYVELYVKDNGIGIDERYHKQIFSVFQRLHTREEYDGTGIGLAIVQKAVEKLKGSIRLESEAGKGSTFFVSLPMLEKSENNNQRRT